jgi:hypothetical protein
MTTATIVTPHPIFLAGRWVRSPIRSSSNPADPAPARLDVQRAQAQYGGGREPRWPRSKVCHLPAYRRGDPPLDQRRIKARRGLGRLMATEAGKLRDALVEVDRATLTFRLGPERADDRQSSRSTS